MGAIVRIIRFWPLLLILALVALFIYLIVTYLHSPAKAKEILIRVFLWITGILCGLSALVALYALLDGNEPVLDLGLGCLVIAAILLGITLLCRWRFLKHNPSYRHKATKAEVIFRWPWER